MDKTTTDINICLNIARNLNPNDPLLDSKLDIINKFGIFDINKVNPDFIYENNTNLKYTKNGNNVFYEDIVFNETTGFVDDEEETKADGKNTVVENNVKNKVKPIKNNVETINLINNDSLINKLTMLRNDFSEQDMFNLFKINNADNIILLLNQYKTNTFIKNQQSLNILTEFKNSNTDIIEETEYNNFLKSFDL